MDTQFANPLPNRLHIPRMTKSETVETGRDHDARPFILEPHTLFSECLGLLYLDHEITVVF